MGRLPYNTLFLIEAELREKYLPIVQAQRGFEIIQVGCGLKPVGRCCFNSSSAIVNAHNLAPPIGHADIAYPVIARMRYRESGEDLLQAFFPYFAGVAITGIIAAVQH